MFFETEKEKEENNKKADNPEEVITMADIAKASRFYGTTTTEVRGIIPLLKSLADKVKKFFESRG